MVIDQLEICQFRNLRNVSVAPSPHLNIIVGKNASGKTSFLESIYYLATARSFRTLHAKQIISFDQDHFILYGNVTSGTNVFGIGIKRDKHATTLKIANRVVNSAAQLAELMPTQIINPDVHKLLEDGPRHRRRFIEWGVFHVKPKYLGLWQQCRHILKQRNAALRQHQSERQLLHWDQMLWEVTHQITQIRNQYILDLTPLLNGLIEKIANFPKIEIRLEQGWPSDKTYLEALAGSRASDLQRGFTQLGAHRADLQILVNEAPAKYVVSRGQQKMLTILMRIAQVNLLQHLGKSAILLVDDLASELDEYFCNLLMEEIAQQPCQVFVTTTDKDFLKVNFADKNSKVFHVEQGQLSERG